MLDQISASTWHSRTPAGPGHLLGDTETSNSTVEGMGSVWPVHPFQVFPVISDDCERTSDVLADSNHPLYERCDNSKIGSMGRL